MNGPRTNQFVAPTSFITSISRRREKIESRIVFAIRSADAIEQDQRRRPGTTISITRATLEDALRDLLAVLDLVDARGSFGCRSAAAIALTSSPWRGVTSNESGSGFEGRFVDELGLALAASARAPLPSRRR